MAFDLRATLRLTDNFSGPARRIMRSASSLAGGIGKLTGIFAGLTGAIGGAVAAKKLFDSTIMEAAKYEQSTVVINAMLNDKDLGKQYMDLVNKFAIDSPIMDSQAMLENSKSFLSIIGGDMKQLEKAWSLAERMAAIDPMQGVEGSVFALREMFSGDAISMVRRFEFPKKVMNEIKKMDVPEQLEALDKYFNKIGMTQKLIDEMGGTTLGIWSQIKEKVAVILRDMGAPALQVLKKFIDEINTGISGGSLEGFKQTGANMIKNIAIGFVNAAKGIGSWISGIQNSPEFQKLNSLHAKVDFVFTDIGQRFSEWLENGGQEKLNGAAKSLIEIASAALMANEGILVSTATAIGAAVGSALFSSASSSFFSKWEGSKLMNIPGMKPFKWVATAGRSVGQKVFGKNDSKPQSKAGGLSYVPRNGAQYTLHKGERVLTPEENKAYNGSRGGVSITGNTFNVREEADIDKIAYKLAKLIEQEGVQMA